VGKKKHTDYCGVCTLACPGKLGKKALEMVPNKDKENNFEYLLKNNVNDKYQSNLLTVKNVSFKDYMAYLELIPNILMNNL